MKVGISTLLLAIACSLGTVTTTLGQGIILPAVGAVNRGMSGATTGAAIESIGSMAWNPATISGLKNELAFGFEALYSTNVAYSTFPGVGSGRTSSEPGAVPIPSFAWVHQLRNPNAKLGLGLYGVAGYATNFPTDPTNPILSPPPVQGGIGLGRVQAEVVFFQMPLSLSLALTDRLSVAAGPTLSIAKISLDENAFVAPNADGRYPRGNGSRYHFGGGAQIGMYFVPNCRWSFGANVKTPSWMENFRYHSEDASGLPRRDEINFDLPAIATFGGAYRPNNKVVLTTDFKYFDYNNTQGLGDPAQFQPNFSIGGLGWRSIFSANFGARLRMTERVFAMFGYVYSDKIIEDENAFFNFGSDLSYQHGFSTGCSLLLNQCASFSLSYSYFPEWGASGPIIAPGIGPVPGSAVTQHIDAHSLTMGVNVNY